MARFYGEVRGKAPSAATREGSEGSGILAHIRGWRLGLMVTGMTSSPDPERDAFVVDLTGGSNGGKPTSYGVLIISEAENGSRRVFVDAGQVTGVSYLHPCGCWDTRSDNHEERCTA